jgi:hypothetical protein
MHELLADKKMGGRCMTRELTGTGMYRCPMLLNSL